MKSKNYHGFYTCLSVLILACTACNSSQFSAQAPLAQKPSEKARSEQPAGTAPNAKIMGTENTNGSKFPQNESFLPTGKSLDLYVIMDKSSSLWRVIDSSGETVAGTDPSCKRFDALLDLIDEMRKKLVAKEQVRLTIVTFGTNPAHFNHERFSIGVAPSARENVVKTLGSMEDLMSQSRSAIDQTFRAGVCADNRDPQYTHYASGIKETLNSKIGLTALKKYDAETALFFSDGAANDPTEEELKEAISNLNNAFPGRLWGILLGDSKTVGNGGGLCTLKKAGDFQMTADECMFMLVGADPSKLLRVQSATDLSAALTGLIK